VECDILLKLGFNVFVFALYNCSHIAEGGAAAKVDVSDVGWLEIEFVDKGFDV
jgi:hypothetical protein